MRRLDSRRTGMPAAGSLTSTALPGLKNCHADPPILINRTALTYKHERLVMVSRNTCHGEQIHRKAPASTRMPPAGNVGGC